MKKGTIIGRFRSVCRSGPSGTRAERSEAGTMPDPFDLVRFVDAQGAVYAGVGAELRQGRKQSHWMWFIFPQFAGLGLSAMAQRFAIRSREEAVAYLGHGVLGPRL